MPQPQSAEQLPQVSPEPHTPSPQPTHCDPLQLSVPGHAVQVPPQPSESPHPLPLQLGVQQLPWWQVWPGPQAQSAAQLEQVSPDWHTPLPHATSSTHWPLWQL